MKKSLLIVFVFVIFQIAVSCAGGVLAQGILGGYKEVARDAEGVEAAADFAVKTQAQKQDVSMSLVSIERAEKQTVAGVNFRLCLKVAIDDETQDIKVVVYRNLKQEYSLTSWTQESCSESESTGN